MDKKQINENIAQLVEQRTRKELIERRLKELDEEMNRQFAIIDGMEKRVDNEAKEVEDLQLSNIRNLISKTLGEDEDRLEMEKEDLLWAVINLKEAQQMMELLKYERQILKTSLDELFSIDERLETLLLVKEQNLKEGSYVSDTLEALNTLHLKLENEKQEIQEALEVASILKDLLKKLETELKQLNDPKKQIDFHGQDRYSSYAKKAYVKKGSDLVTNINHLMKKLENELNDLRTKHDINLTQNVDQLSKFFVILFENLINSFLVRRSFKDAIHSIESAEMKIEKLILKLNHEYEKSNKRILKIGSDREELLINS